MEKNKKSENSTYAIIRHGGKQYRVTEGSLIKVDKINSKDGEEFTFSDVLSVMKDGALEKAGGKGTSVKAKVVRQVKDKKVITFKKKELPATQKSKDTGKLEVEY